MHLQLTTDEQRLYDGLQAEPHDHITWTEAGQRMVALMRSLVARDAIPEVRLRYFLDPEFNPGGTTSRREVFVRNGCETDEKIYDHPNFLKYLRYFVEGPRLPATVVNGFRAIVANSLREWDALDAYARAKVRELGARSADEAHEEFFKLALECGVSLSEAMRIRTNARTAVRRRSRR